MDELEGSLWLEGRYEGLRHWEGPDPLEQEQNRRKMLVYLARYARTPPSEWLDEDVAEMIAFFNATSDLVGEEKATLTGE